VNKGQHVILISGLLIALLAVAIPFGSESFAKPDKCDEWPNCPGKGGGGNGKTAFDFTLDLSSSFISIEQESSDFIYVTISQPSGNGNVNLSASNIPVGVTISFDQTNSKISPNNPPFTSTMTIVVSSTGSSGTIDVHASAKGTTKTATLDLTVNEVTPPNTPPTVSINFPSTDTKFTQGNPASFSGTATDVQDGNMSSQIQWSSNIDNSIGNGALFSTSSLSVGTHTITATATDLDGMSDFDTAQITVTAPLPTPDNPVIVAAGDIACDPDDTSNPCRHQATSDRLMIIDPFAVFTLGDNQYPNGGLSDYQDSYHPTWGRTFDKTYPSPGNHEYGTSYAGGYFDYFGAKTGPTENEYYYSFDIGSWHIVSLNSNCTEEGVGGCSTNSPQGIWLKNDLESHGNACTLVYWHHPRYSAGSHGDNSKMDYFWQLLDANNVDVALAGHDHNYQRFAPMDLTGASDPNGVREFVVGTGGKSHYSLNSEDDNLEAFNISTFGVLKMTLHDTSYDWNFVGESGNTIDSGSWNCNVN